MHNRRQVNSKSWLLYAGVLGLTISMLGPLFIPPTPSSALSNAIDPNGNGTVDVFTVTGAASAYEAIDDGTRQPTTPNTGDYITASSNSNASAFFPMDTLAGVQSVSEITVWIYHNDVGNNGFFYAQLYDANESTTHSSESQFANATTATWDSLTFSGLSLNQAQLDDLNVRIRLERPGGGKPENAELYAMYAQVTYSVGPQISITSDAAVEFGAVAPGTARDTTAGDLNDVQTVSIDGDPVDLDVRSTNFSDGGNTWTLGAGAGNNQARWEFSANGSDWSLFSAPDTLFSLDTNVPNGATRDFYLRLTAPTATGSWGEHATTITIVATVP